MVVLATGIVPSGINLNLNPPAGRAGKDQNNFISDLQSEGIYPVACSRKPMDVSSSVKDATAAALKAIQ